LLFKTTIQEIADELLLPTIPVFGALHYPPRINKEREFLVLETAGKLNCRSAIKTTPVRTVSLGTGIVIIPGSDVYRIKTRSKLSTGTGLNKTKTDINEMILKKRKLKIS